MVNPEDISKQADWERKKEKQRNENKPRKKVKPGWQSHPCDSWYVFRRIYPVYPNFFWWFFVVLTLGVVFITIYFSTTSHRAIDHWSIFVGLGFIALFIIRYIIHFILKFIAFKKYKGWRDRMGFKINGWEVLGSKKDFPRTHYWDKDVVYTVHLESYANDTDRKTIHDALYLFTVKANGCFYEKYFAQSGYSGEPRVKWNFNEGLSVRGSANDDIMGYIYLNIVNYIHAIHKKSRAVKSVEIKCSGQLYEVQPPSTD